MRLIDADALVEIMKADDPEVWVQDDYMFGQHDQYLVDLTTVEAMPTVHLWRSMVTYGPPNAVGWYWVYAPSYTGGSSTSREHHNGIMFSKWTGKGWSIERYYYNRPGCVVAWMPLPELPKDGDAECA